MVDEGGHGHGHYCDFPTVRNRPVVRAKRAGWCMGQFLQPQEVIGGAFECVDVSILGEYIAQAPQTDNGIYM